MLAMSTIQSWCEITVVVSGVATAQKWFVTLYLNMLPFYGFISLSFPLNIIFIWLVITLLSPVGLIQVRQSIKAPHLRAEIAIWLMQMLHTKFAVDSSNVSNHFVLWHWHGFKVNGQLKIGQTRKILGLYVPHLFFFNASLLQLGCIRDCWARTGGVKWYMCVPTANFMPHYSPCFLDFSARWGHVEPFGVHFLQKYCFDCQR